jgi:nitrogen fixation protein NifQ
MTAVLDSPISLYASLVDSPGPGDPFDRHVFACILAAAAGEPERSLSEACGLSSAELNDLFDAYFPLAHNLLSALLPDGETGVDQWEEPDLRRLLVDNGTAGGREERWLAAMVARRSLLPNHLWEDLGLLSRRDLSGFLHRHFAPLAARNVRDMKWKKFFYKQLCEETGLSLCKSPVCDDCADFAVCFGPEDQEHAP